MTYNRPIPADYLTLGQAAQALGIARNTLRKLMPPPTVILGQGARKFYKVSDVEELRSRINQPVVKEQNETK
jgi:hypothetical protein